MQNKNKPFDSLEKAFLLMSYCQNKLKTRPTLNEMSLSYLRQITNVFELISSTKLPSINFLPNWKKINYSGLNLSFSSIITKILSPRQSNFLYQIFE